jgi:hypothetical protein
MRSGLKMALNCIKLSANSINGSSERRWWSGACVQLPTLYATVAEYQPLRGRVSFREGMFAALLYRKSIVYRSVLALSGS